MLNAHAHRKGLRLHRYARRVYGAERVARAVTDGEDRAARLQTLLALGRADGQRRERAVFGFDACHAVLKAHLAAEGDHVLADCAHHVYQHVRADVGLGVVDNVLRRAVRGKLLQHPADALVVRVRVELAVGECPRAALAELHVALGIKHPARAERLHLFAARVHILSALQYDRARARLGEPQRREHARGSEADHDRTLRAAFHMRNGVGDVVHNGRLPAPRGELFLAAGDRHADRVDIPELRLAPGVERFFADGERFDPPGVNAERFRRLFLQQRLRLPGL